jgi:hypothetical protein
MVDLNLGCVANRVDYEETGHPDHEAYCPNDKFQDKEQN